MTLGDAVRLIHRLSVEIAAADETGADSPEVIFKQGMIEGIVRCVGIENLPNKMRDLIEGAREIWANR